MSTVNVTETKPPHGHLLCANEECLHIWTNTDRAMELPECMLCGGQWVLVVRCRICPQDQTAEDLDMYVVPSEELTPAGH